ncbi:MAG: GNAT family N-acetyltransferase, partial [Planctomycetota bacterium]|nr:GNAT family N-acetyltransferase [Planctomycetota bacterium]
MKRSGKTQSDDSNCVIREASRDDIPQLEDLVDHFVNANRLLPRTFDELCDLISFGFVAEIDGKIVGFAALEIYSAKLAEIRSLAVHEGHQGKGIGRRLVQRCVDLA